AFGVPVILNTALSPAGSPTSGLSSDGFLNVARTAPLIGGGDACPPWRAGDVWPFTEAIETAEIENDVGTSTSTQAISSPPPLPPRFWTVIVTGTGAPT